MEQTPNDLCIHAQTYDSLDPDCIVCPIKGNTILYRKSCGTCEYYNYDFKNHPEKICGMCEAFLGWGDWGLSCRKHYHALPNFLSKACEDFTTPTT